jgi:hypothetical protein
MTPSPSASRLAEKSAIMPEMAALAPTAQATASASAPSSAPAISQSSASASAQNAASANPPATPKTAASASSPAKAAVRYADVLIKDVPHVVQKPDFCGEACAEMALKSLGSRIDQDEVFNQSGLDPALGRGCYTRELAAALERIGFKIGDVFTRITPAAASTSTAARPADKSADKAAEKSAMRPSDKAAAEIEAQWAALYADLVRGIPSIVCMYYDERMKTPEHFRLILGYDAKTDEVIFHEPAVKKGAYLRIPREAFLRLWPLRGVAMQTVIRLRLEPGKTMLTPPVRRGFTPADYAQHVLALKEKLPPDVFHVAIAAPFVVVGDESESTVRLRAERTVKWAVDKIKADYFEKDPPEMIDVWLFRDEVSYQKYTHDLFNDTPTTPYGYYSAAHTALIMNIATGGGTLVHEIVHPYMRANFPACPDWFNEGLASLYEQSEEKAGHIHGATNWRLAGLQKTIEGGKLPTLEALCSTTNSEFYNKDKGANYGEARYLCYYLQEKNLLTKFYREFVANQKADPTGYKSLQKVLGESDMAAFQKRWETYAMKLTFP